MKRKKQTGKVSCSMKSDGVEAVRKHHKDKRFGTYFSDNLKTEIAFMSSCMYFAADLSHVFLLMPDGSDGSPGPPVALWYKPAGVGSKLTPVWLVTVQTTARIVWQVDQLRRRYAAGDYPADKLDEINERVRPILEYALEEFGLATLQEEMDRLERIGGPREKLLPGDPGVPTPWDAEVTLARSRWDQNRGRFERVEPDPSVTKWDE